LGKLCSSCAPLILYAGLSALRPKTWHPPLPAANEVQKAAAAAAAAAAQPVTVGRFFERLLQEKADYSECTLNRAVPSMEEARVLVV